MKIGRREAAQDGEWTCREREKREREIERE